MRDLYEALGTLALNEDLMDAVFSVYPNIVHCPEYARGKVCPSPRDRGQRESDVDFKWENQPDPVAIGRIDELFRGVGLFLSAYELAEINRWCAAKSFWGQMSDIRNALNAAGVKEVDSQGKVLIGALIVDIKLRARLIAEKLDRAWFGYRTDLAGDLETKLIGVFAEGSPAHNAADGVERDGWSPNHCLVIQKYYEGWFHINT